MAGGGCGRGSESESERLISSSLFAAAARCGGRDGPTLRDAGAAGRVDGLGGP